MKGRNFKLQSCLAGVNPRFWKPTEFPGKESDLLKKNSSWSDAPYIVGNASCWSWTDKLKLAGYIMNYKFVSTNPSAMYTCVRLTRRSVLSHFVDDPFCPQMGSSLIMCMLKIVQKSVLQWDVPWLPAFLETSSNLTIFEWESFQKTIKHFRWMMGVTCGTPRCWKLRWGWRPLKVEYSSLKEEDFYFPS